MGIIKAVKQAIGGGFADTWQEVIEPDNIGDQTVYARGVLVNRITGQMWRPVMRMRCSMAI